MRVALCHLSYTGNNFGPGSSNRNCDLSLIKTALCRLSYAWMDSTRMELNHRFNLTKVANYRNSSGANWSLVTDSNDLLPGTDRHITVNVYKAKSGADRDIRNPALRVTSAMLSHLSYIGN